MDDFFKENDAHTEDIVRRAMGRRQRLAEANATSSDANNPCSVANVALVKNTRSVANAGLIKNTCIVANAGLIKNTCSVANAGLIKNTCSVAKVTLVKSPCSVVNATCSIVNATCSVASRIQTFQNKLVSQEVPKMPCPEKLPVRAKASLFEAAIKQETLDAAKTQRRDQFLRQQKTGAKKIFNPSPEVPLKNDILQARAAIKSDNKQEQNQFDEEPMVEEPRNKEQEQKVINSVASSCASSGIGKTGEWQQTFSNGRLVKYSDEAERHEPQGQPSTAINTGLDGAFSNETGAYFARPILVCDSDAQNSLPSYSSSDASTSERSCSSTHSASSTRLYPDLPTVDDCEVYQSSPSKQARYDDVQRPPPLSLSPVKKISSHNVLAETKEKMSTPMRTLSTYRIQQKTRGLGDDGEQHQRIVYGASNEAADREALVLKEQKRKETLRRRVSELKLESKNQEQIMAQASKAINLCQATAEGSASHVEAERTLLVATTKHAATRHHIHNLNSLMTQDGIRETINGSLKITTIEVPIAQDIITSYAKGQGIHSDRELYLFCVVTCDSQVVGTEVLNIREAFGPKKLDFKFTSAPFEVKNLQNNFQALVEVYGLSLPKPYDHKHKNHKTNVRSTPKKARKQLQNAAQASETVRSSEVETRAPRAKVFGSIAINLSNARKREHMLHNFVTGCPLIGTIELKAELQASYDDVLLKNFMNFYEERDSGIWVRRWCVLNGYKLSYWKYQEDEIKTGPTGVIDLRNCINPEITPVSQETCARKNTFMLLTANNKETFARVQYMLHKSYNTMITTRYLIAADLRHERDEWLQALNNVVKHVRMWERSAVVPCSKREAETLMK